MPDCQKCIHKSVCEKKTCFECQNTSCGGCELYDFTDGRPDVKNCDSFIDESQGLKDFVTNIHKCNFKHHGGCLAPDCFTCFESLFNLTLIDLFPDRFTKQSVNENKDNSSFCSES